MWDELCISQRSYVCNQHCRFSVTSWEISIILFFFSFVRARVFSLLQQGFGAWGFFLCDVPVGLSLGNT